MSDAPAVRCPRVGLKYRIKMTPAEGSRLIEGADTQMKADTGQGGGEGETVKKEAKVDLRSKER